MRAPTARSSAATASTRARWRSSPRGASRARGPSRRGPAAGPRRCGRRHPREPPCPAARRAAAGPRGCAGRGRAARRGGRHRRPRRRPGRGRGPGRRRPTGCRRRRGGRRARRRGSRGSGRPGPPSAVRVTWWPTAEHVGEGGVDAGDVASVGHADQRARGPTRTSRRRPRPPSAASRRPEPPTTPRGGPALREPAQEGVGVLDAAPRAGLAGDEGAERPRRRPLLGGRRGAAGPPGAARRTGRRRSAGRADSLSVAISGASTGSALTTRRRGWSRPVWSVSRPALDDVAVDVLAGEPHLHPGARHGRLGHRRGTG